MTFTLSLKSKSDADWNRVVTSLVTDMSDLFRNETTFNQDISSWDTSNVTNMSHMFYEAFIFDQPLNNWDTSNVTTMEFMFGRIDNFSVASAMDFNQDIGDWNVGKVQNIVGQIGKPGGTMRSREEPGAARRSQEEL